MTPTLWTAVDQYFNAQLIGPDAALDAALAASDAAGLPPIQVSPPQGKLLHLLARLVGARHILEIGTLAGYSTIWLARAVPPGGQVVTLEIDARHAAVAEANFARAGLAARVELRLGPALETLPRLAAERSEPFDLTFIDADKPNIPAYFDWALRLARRGSVIVIDNVVRDGRVVAADDHDPNIQGVRELIDRLATEPRCSATALQTVGGKGYDGFALVLVTGEP
jgi:predicted O-methyltransferase YrrM